MDWEPPRKSEGRGRERTGTRSTNLDCSNHTQVVPNRLVEKQTLTLSLHTPARNPTKLKEAWGGETRRATDMSVCEHGELAGDGAEATKGRAKTIRLRFSKH